MDLIVAGGGPGGLATAILAAMAGWTTTVVEPRPGIIDKACGEGLMPPTLGLLQRMGVTVHGHPLAGIRYVDGPHRAEARFPRGTGLGVRRTVLHEALGERAAALGVVRREGRVTGIEQSPGAVQVALENGERLRGRFLVAADGLHSPLRRLLGLQAPSRLPRRYGIRRHFAMAPWSRFVEVHWSRTAEAYVTPVSANCVGVAVLFSGQGSFEHWLEGFPELRARLENPCTPAAGGGPFEQRSSHRSVGQAFLVGDAAGFLDPITGEGIRLSLMAAEALVTCLVQGRPEAYDNAWLALTRHYWQLTSALLWIQRTRWLRPCVVPVTAACPWLLRRGIAYLLHEAGWDYQRKASSTLV